MKTQLEQQRFYDTQTNLAEVVTDMDGIAGVVRDRSTDNPLNIYEYQHGTSRLLRVRVRISKADFPVFYGVRVWSIHVQSLYEKHK